MNIQQWDEYASLYNKGIGKSGDALHQDLINPIIFDFIKSWKDLSILDVGCGNGYLINKLAPLAKRVVGIDASKNLLKFAMSQVSSKNVSFQLADITKKQPFDDSSFDVIIANMVVQYLPSLENFVQECRRVLKSNGKLIIIIDHPAHSLFLRAQELIGKKNDKFLISGSYFKSGLRKKKSLWSKAILEYCHRPLMEYINIFSEYFRLEKMEEKSEDEEIPRILGLLWSKIK